MTKEEYAKVPRWRKVCLVFIYLVATAIFLKFFVSMIQLMDASTSAVNKLVGG